METLSRYYGNSQKAEPLQVKVHVGVLVFCDGLMVGASKC